MIGGSYGGQNQFAIAGQDDRIDAIIPTITWNDLSYSLARTTPTRPRASPTTPRGLPRRSGSTSSSALGIVSGLQNTTTTADPDPIVGCPNFRDRGLPRQRLS